MNVFDFLQSLSAGSVVSVIVLLLTLVEITPIKISPLAWIGKRINQDMSERLDEIEKTQKEQAKNLDEHIAQSYRDKIFTFQNELLRGQKHTREAFDEVLEAADYYEAFVSDNGLRNGKADAAIDYINRVYQKCQDERSFMDLERK